VFSHVNHRQMPKRISRALSSKKQIVKLKLSPKHKNAKPGAVSWKEKI